MNLSEQLKNVQKKHPLIHNITNYVSANECANTLLACGASPIMSDEPSEVKEITSLANGLHLNIGTLNQQSIPSMFLAGKQANAKKIPVLLDPVGAGASTLRTQTALMILKEIKCSAICGNMSEIKALIQNEHATHGVDAATEDAITKENLGMMVSFAKLSARQTGAVVAITGAIDIVADSEKAACIYNGHPSMTRVTGIGCQLSSMTCAFIASNPDTVFDAVCASVCAMGLAGSTAHKRLSKDDGNASYQRYITDTIYHLSPEELQKGANYELR